MLACYWRAGRIRVSLVRPRLLHGLESTKESRLSPRIMPPVGARRGTLAVPSFPGVYYRRDPNRTGLRRANFLTLALQLQCASCSADGSQVHMLYYIGSLFLIIGLS